MEIDVILEKLFGEIYPYGSTDIDSCRYNNIVNYQIALDYIVNRLLESAKFKNDKRFSVNNIAERCYNLLYNEMEIIQNELKNVEE